MPLRTITKRTGPPRATKVWSWTFSPFGEATSATFAFRPNTGAVEVPLEGDGRVSLLDVIDNLDAACTPPRRETFKVTAHPNLECLERHATVGL